MPHPPALVISALTIIAVTLITLFTVHAGSPAFTPLATGKCYTVGLTQPPYTSVTVCPPVG